MGQSTIGVTRLILPKKPLEPGNLLKGAVEFKLKQALKPTLVTFSLESKERTIWMEERKIYNPVRNKHERVNVDVGSTDIQSLATFDHPIHLDMQFPAGNYTYPFELSIPQHLKPAMSLQAGEGEASFCYQLKVRLSSNAGVYCSHLPLPTPSDEELVDDFNDPTIFSQGFGKTVTFKPVLREVGVLNVYAKLVKGFLASKKPLEVVLDLDNTRNPYDVRNAYLSLERSVVLKGDSGREFTHHEIVKTQELDCLPVRAKAFVQHYYCQVPISDSLDPSFTGALISHEYKLNLNVVSGSKLASVQTILLSDVTVVAEAEKILNSEDDAEAPLVKEGPISWVRKWVNRADWKTVAMNSAIAVLLKLIEVLLKRK